MQITSSTSWAAPLAAVLLTGVVLGSWQDPETTAETAVRTVTPGQIAESPDAFEDRKVRIRSAEVEDVRTARLFTLDEDEFGAAPDVMVLIPQPAVGTSVEEGQRVTVIGTVREMQGAAFQRDYHWWDEGAFTPEIDMIGARPVVVAESVKTEKGVELVGTPVAAKGQ